MKDAKEFLVVFAIVCAGIFVTIIMSGVALAVVQMIWNALL